MDRTAAHDTTRKLEEVSMDVCLPGRNIGASSGEHWARSGYKMISRAGWYSGWSSGTVWWSRPQPALSARMASRDLHSARPPSCLVRVSTPRRKPHLGVLHWENLPVSFTFPV